MLLALARLRGKFANIHISDNDPRSVLHLNYDGCLGLDLCLTKSLVSAYKRSVEHIRTIARELRIPIEV